jgi:transposase
VVLQQALADLNSAYRNFFAPVTGRRKGPRMAPPRFRSRKDSRQAIRFTANARFQVLDNGKLRLPKIGDVKVRWSRDLPAVPSSVTAMLEYKARLYGREFRKIGRFEPTSQVCSACGARGGPKPLSVRTWTCAECGTVHDRDVNAARNILALGRRERLNARGGQVRPLVTAAPAGEAGSRRCAA